MLHFNLRHRNRRRSPQNTPVQDDQYPVQLSSVEWKNVNESDSEFPSNAFVACKLETGEEGFVAKANIGWQIVSGVTTKNGMVASIPYASSEHLIHSFEVLATNNPDSLCWQTDSNGNVPKFAVQGGIDCGEQSYIGRTCTPLDEARTAYHEKLQINHQCEGASRVGKIHPSHRCLYVSYNGREYVFPRYKVLCHKVSSSNLADICRWKILLYFHQKQLDIQLLNELQIPTFLKNFLLNKNRTTN